MPVGSMNYGALLDRLTDESVGKSGDDLPSLARLKEGLRRDLEALFNTRRRFLSTPSDLTELDRSLLNYGLDDLTNENINDHTFRYNFVVAVDRLLRRLEPRITNFEVVLLDNPDPLDRMLRFRIVGQVDLGEERQELHFDSHVDPVRAGIIVRE